MVDIKRILRKIKHEMLSREGFYSFLSYIPVIKRGRVNELERPVVVSLTSVPWRFEKLHAVLMSLLWQTVRPDKIVLWLSEFNQKGERIVDPDNLPENLRRMQRKGIEIKFAEDIRSYRKLIPSLERFPDAIIITVDDDTLYPVSWLENLLAAHEEQPRAVVCYRGTRIQINQDGLAPYIQWPEYTTRGEPSYLLFAQGCGGILYPPGALHPEVHNREAFMELSPTADDVWFKAMVLYNGVPHVKISERHRDFPPVYGSQAEGQTLHHVNNTLGHNDQQVAAVFSRYDLVSRLKAAASE